MDLFFHSISHYFYITLTIFYTWWQITPTFFIRTTGSFFIQLKLLHFWTHSNFSATSINHFPKLETEVKSELVYVLWPQSLIIRLFKECETCNLSGSTVRNNQQMCLPAPWSSPFSASAPGPSVSVSPCPGVPFPLFPWPAASPWRKKSAFIFYFISLCCYSSQLFQIIIKR